MSYVLPSHDSPPHCTAPHRTAPRHTIVTVLPDLRPGGEDPPLTVSRQGWQRYRTIPQSRTLSLDLYFWTFYILILVHDHTSIPGPLHPSAHPRTPPSIHPSTRPRTIHPPTDHRHGPAHPPDLRLSHLDNLILAACLHRYLGLLPSSSSSSRSSFASLVFSRPSTLHFLTST